MPGPIVLATTTRFTVNAFDRRRAGPFDGCQQRVEVLQQLFGAKAGLANRRMDVRRPVHAELNAARLGFFDQARQVRTRRNGAGARDSASDRADQAHGPDDRPCPSSAAQPWLRRNRPNRPESS